MKGLFISAGILVGIGLLVLSSISQRLFFLQAMWIVLGALAVAILWKIDLRSLLTYRWLVWGLYILAIILLVVVFVSGRAIRSTRGWLEFGSLNFQPVEFAKIALILVYAEYFSRRHLSVARIRNIAASFFLFALPGGLVLLQPDLGSTVVLFGIWFGFLLVSGLPLKRISAAILIFLALGAVGWSSFLEDYHRERIIGVFYPEKNVLGINYSVAQAKIAIGSAGVWGKGYGQGTQTQLGFLTEPGTDFILAALIEEWGVAAGAFVVSVFLFLVYKILKTGLMAEQNFEKFICLGAAMVFGIQFFLNSGSVVGVLPVIGVPFPFLSYGGSSLLTSFLLLGTIGITRRQA